MFWKTVGRLILIPIAFIFAMLTSAAITITIGLERMTQAMHGKEPGLETVEAYTDLAFKGFDLITGLSILPALAVVIIGEVASIRSWLYYMIGGGVALAAIPLLAQIGHGGADAVTTQPAVVWQLLATAGFAGGLVYWLIAGRNA